METWRTVRHEGCEAYEVSDHGNVRRKGSEKCLSLVTGLYVRIGLMNRDSGKKHTFALHRIVARAFLDDWDETLTVDHIDGDPHNNRASNLRMLSHADNIRARPPAKKNDKNTRRDIEQYNLCGELIAVHHSAAEAAEAIGQKWGRRNIYACAVGKWPSAYGYKWKLSVRDADADLPGEIWKTFRGSTAYVSDMGRYKRKYAKGFSHVKMGEELNKQGPYPSFEAHGKTIMLHRAVAELFLPPPADGESVVNHINGNKNDANASNLEWVTKSENSLHAHRIGLYKKQKV